MGEGKNKVAAILLQRSGSSFSKVLRKKTYQEESLKVPLKPVNVCLYISVKPITTGM